MAGSFRFVAPAWALVIALLEGCASSPPQSAVAMSPQTVVPGSGRIGVAMTRMPQVDTYFPGAGCLLCMAAASVANSQMTNLTKALPQEDLPKLKQDVAARLRKSGAEVVIIEDDLVLKSLPDSKSEAPNFASKDFTAMQKKYDIARLVVLEVNTLGIERTYSGYIPTSEPKAVIRGRGYMVNLANNQYEWYLPIEILRSSDGKWDEPPRFPGLSNAYFQTVEVGRDAFLKPFDK